MVLRILIIFLAFSAHGQEFKTITPEQFIAENPSTERQDIVDFIIHQFDSKRDKGVTQAQIDQLWNNYDVRRELKMARFQIVNQKLYAESFSITHHYFLALVDYFQNLLKTYQLKDMDFIIYLRDEIFANMDIAKITMDVPAFLMFRDQDMLYESNKLLFPDANFFKKNEWNDLIPRINQASIVNLWQNKMNSLFWRGKATGIDYIITNFDKIPRLKVVVLSKLYPDLIDAKFVGLFQSDANNEEVTSILELMQQITIEKTSPEYHLKYKYLLSLDGNSATGTRVSWIMLSNSVLVKQESQKIQWYYDALKPYTHYVPLKENLSDILSQITWMQAHDQDLQKITQNAHNFVKNELMPEHVEAHVLLILNEYHSIQKDPLIKASLTPAEELFLLPSLIKHLIYKTEMKIKIWIRSWF